jgi:3-hydroxybutyryl-CoA dehydrogenase
LAQRYARADAVLASNTSVIPITAIMANIKDGTRTVGTHWWNPPFLVPLVEVIGTDRTSQATIDMTMELHTSIGKTPVHVKKDVPGFVGNRLQHALWREAIALVAEGICDARTVDTVIKASFGRRLAVLGPLENSDLIGTELTLDIHKTIIPALDRSTGPNSYLDKLMAEGKFGVKSGEGFMAWTPEEAQALRKRVFTHLKKANAADRGQGD